MLIFIAYINFFSMVSLVVMTPHSPALISGLLKKLLLGLPSRATFCTSQVQMLNISFFIFPYSYLINERRKITKSFFLTICGILSYGNHKIYKLANLNATYLLYGVLGTNPSCYCDSSCWYYSENNYSGISFYFPD